MKKYCTYIINLETSVVRKEYIRNLFLPYPPFDLLFVNAVDGRKLSNDELQKAFDSLKCLDHNGRVLNGGEIGCVLSHRKCCRKLLESSHAYALVLEDDVHLMRDLSVICEADIERVLNVEEPTVLLLSGDYWYWRKNSPILSVFDAVGAYAYFINRAAAERILSIPKPYNVADDWTLYKSLGIRLKAFQPYLMDANVNMEVLGSDVSQDTWGIDRRRMAWKEIWLSYQSALVKKLLKMSGRFESKIRVMHNKVVDQ